MTNTSTWYTSLDQSDRKVLLCLLHDLRRTVPESVPRRARSLLLELIQELDEEHAAAKVR
jgi:hypothetical protein